MLMANDFSAILLAAGEGQRLRPYTFSIPKCLMPINGIPILDLWIDHLVSHEGLREIFINTSYLAENVENHIKHHKHKSKISLTNETKLLGTAGTVKQLVSQIKSKHVFIAHADNLSYFDFEKFFLDHLKRPEGCQLTMMTFDTQDPCSCGIVTLNHERIVIGYKEKPKIRISGEANAAVYFFTNESLKTIERMANISDLSRDVIPQFIGKIFAWKNDCYHRDIGNPESYKLGQTEFLQFKLQKEKK